MMAQLGLGILASPVQIIGMSGGCWEFLVQWQAFSTEGFDDPDYISLITKEPAIGYNPVKDSSQKLSCVNYSLTLE